MTEPSPLFTVVIATRDRPTLFRNAILSVATQSHTDMEIIVVNDGSSPEVEAAYQETLAQVRGLIGSERLRYFTLIRRSKGHGSSYSLNVGVEHARGQYVCFLDDDDVWIDENHLTVAAEVLGAERLTGRTVDVYTTNQEAFRGEVRQTGAIWLEALDGILRKEGREPLPHGAFLIGTKDALQAGGFCHLNCLMVRRELWVKIGGLDESIRWENDRELFFRLVDVAPCVLHAARVTARHHIPDSAKKASITTSLDELERRMWQVRVMDKLIAFSNHSEISDYARLHKGYAYKRIVQVLVSRNSWPSAFVFALQALVCAPSFKWFVYTLYCRAKVFLGRVRVR